MKKPTFLRERKLVRKGYNVVGVDEVGCGCLAGPVVAAAVELPFSVRISLIRDSKLLSAHQREQLFLKFLERRLPFGVGIASVLEIEKLNIRRAGILAMERAVLAFSEMLHENEKIFLLTDAWRLPDLPWSQEGIIHGDRKVKSIAAASIIAKVIRDHLMGEYDAQYSGFFFGKHKGYGTALHQAMLKKLGHSPLHRRSFLKKFALAP